jgi:hypothetical protein
LLLRGVLIGNTFLARCDGLSNSFSGDKMKALELYKFVKETESEYQWIENDVVLFIHTSDIADFNDLFSANELDEEGIVCNMKQGYFCFMMQDICEYNGIQLNEIFEGGK